MKIIKPDPKFKEFAEDIINQFRDAFNLHNYTIHLKYVKKISAHTFSPEKGGASAETEQDPVYMDITISLTKKLQNQFLAGEIEEVTYVLCHEMVHHLLQGYWEFAFKTVREDEVVELTKLNENQTQLFTMVLMKHIKLDFSVLDKKKK